MNSETKKGILIGVLIFLAASLRWVEHPLNTTPIVAIILFSVAFIKDLKWKIAIPLSVMILSDVIINLKNGYGFHNSAFLVYGTFALIFIVAGYMLKKVNVVNVLGASLMASVLFYLVTNFAFFYPVSAVPNPALGQYPHNWLGIVSSYQAGLPYFKNMLVGDLIYTSVLFGAYYLITQASFFEKKNIA